MATTKYQIGTLTVVALVALRLGIGWHFFKEGAKKFHNPDFTANVFFEQAKGPLAGVFQMMVPDRTGHLRLDRKATKDAWQAYANRVARHFGFDQQQQQRADNVRKQWLARLDQFFSDNGEEIKEYFLQVQRVVDAKTDKTMRDVPFQRVRITSKEAELRATLGGFTSQLKSIAQQYQRDLHAIANAQQRQRGDLAIPDVSRSYLDTIVKFFITGVGVCLILGLLTRTASLAGAAFLLSVIATQPPWVAGSATIFFYYQMVELLALLLLAAIGAGRFAGLDFFIHSIRIGGLPSDKGDT